MTIALLERAAVALGPLVAEVAFLGGATVELWITDPGAPAPRPTKDVDVVVEITTRAGFDEFQGRLRGPWVPRGRRRPSSGAARGRRGR